MKGGHEIASRGILGARKIDSSGKILEGPGGFRTSRAFGHVVGSVETPSVMYLS